MRLSPVALVVAIAVATALPARADVSVGQRISARVQRVKTGFLKWQLGFKERRALGRIEKERGRLAEIGIHANVPVSVVAKREKTAILDGLRKEAQALAGARAGTGLHERRQTLLGRIGQLTQEIAADEALVPNGSKGTSNHHGVYLEPSSTKGAELTQNLAHELTHASEMSEMNRLQREAERIQASPHPSPGLQRRLATIGRRIETLHQELGIDQGHDETRADYMAAYALGAQGKAIGTGHLWGWRGADARYPAQAMAAANIEGYLKGVALRATGGARSLTARERAYLAGFRAALEEGARISFQTAAPQPKDMLARLRDLRPSASGGAAGDGDFEAGRRDAVGDKVPRLP